MSYWIVEGEGVHGCFAAAARPLKHISTGPECASVCTIDHRWVARVDGKRCEDNGGRDGSNFSFPN